MKPKDNPDITKWKLLRGMPRISPHFVDAAKKMAPKSLQPFIAPAGSVRIDHEIRKKTRLTTPVPQRQTWQNDKVPNVRDDQKPHWVSFPTETTKAATKRIQSAPVGRKGYTYYSQGTNMNEPTDNMTSRLESWAKNASNYEKQVVFNMLKQVTPREEDVPETPDADQFLRTTSFPDNLQRIQNSQALHKQHSAKARNVTSAPVKKTGGLVASAHQHPVKDQRVYRLKGQDARIDPTPQEERNLNLLMDRMRRTNYPVTKENKKYVSVPMHTYLPRKQPVTEDYQCKVSFFQTVRSPFKSHFVIHPDFTSENLKHRKPVSHMITHFRY